MFLLSLFLFCLPTVVQAQEHPDAQAIVTGVNQERANAGLPPLTVHPLLNQAAQNHVDDMIANGIYGHMGSDGSYARQRVQRVGYSAGGYASENWVSATSPENAMTWWMNDWIHRENILNRRWVEFGVGVGVAPNGRTIYVTVFTAGSDGRGNENAPVQVAANFDPIPAGGLDYTIQPGDTLIAIAARYGLDWTFIAQANQLTEYTILQIGQVIRLPGVENVGGPAQAPTAVSFTQPKASPVAGALYLVQPGDTLLSIALRHNLAWQELAAVNNLGERDLLQIGQNLTLPGGVTAQPAVDEPHTATPSIVMSLPVTSESATPLLRRHTVGHGETLLSIAQKYGLPWQALAAANGLRENDLLQIDQVLTIPSQTDASAVGAASPAPQTHIVSSGETIISIALRYNLAWQQLLQLNGLSEDSVLQVGQQLRLR